MSQVDYVEDKWKWYLRLEYGVRTVVAYITFGGALGMVQCRHAITQRQLRWRTWRQQHLKALPDLESADDTPPPPQPDASHGTDAREHLAAARVVREALASQRSELCPELDDALFTVFWTFYWQPLLREFDALMAMTHGEAVNVRLLSALEKQANAFNAHAARCHGDAPDIFPPCASSAGSDAEFAGETPLTPPPAAQDAASSSDTEAVFVMSSTDRAAHARRVCAAAAPPSLSYSEAVRLTYLLSEVIASELHCLREAAHAHVSALPATSSSSQSSLVEASCVSLMLPNSVEYNPIWLACARAGCLQTLLSTVGSHLTSTSTTRADPVVYRPCATALINTNLASNAMLFHALECAGSAIFIMDAQFAPLLFAMPEADETTVGPVHVPACVKRIFLWRLGDEETESARQAAGLATLTVAMREAIHAFNALPYHEESCEEAARQPGCSHDAASRAVLSPLSYNAEAQQLEIDLWRAVKLHYEPESMSVTKKVSSYSSSSSSSSPATFKANVCAVGACEAGSWAERCSWKSLHWLPLLSSKVLEWYGPALARSLDTAHTQSPPAITLRAMYAMDAPRLMTALRRFTITEPVLFIYTSGTTGLPKAARFSHLRFFATAFLSRLLSMRETTRRVLKEQAKERDTTRSTAMASYGPGSVAADTNDEKAGTGTAQASDAFLQSLDRRAHVPRHAKWVVTLLTVWSFLRWLLLLIPRLLGLTGRWYYTEAQLEEEKALSVLTVYNALPMYHTVGCVFCLGHLLHALEEQQTRQAHMASRWHEPFFWWHPAYLATLPLPTARMIVRHKYSASNFRKDLAQYRVTVAQYIGEILRYAVLFERRHAPQSIEQLETDDKDNNKNKKNMANPLAAPCLPASLALSERALLTLRNQSSWRVPYLFGNGLRLDIWQECIDRLNVAQPVEFYSSTEGNIFLFNLFNIPGSIGHIPRLGGRFWTVEYIPFFPFRVLRFEEATQDVWRDPTSGFCSRVGVGEVGEVCGEVVQGFDMFALRRFDGYHHSHSHSSAATAAGTGNINDAELQTNRKLIRHVMWPNTDDLFFRSGDLIKFDEDGFCFFVDRVGETFRWKGENVSTLEVSNALNTVHSSHVGVLEAVVYGVSVPGREGRAGMAMLTLQPRTFSAAGGDAKTESGTAGHGAVREHVGAASSPSRTVTLTEERLFLQNDLYRFVSGQCSVNGDGSVNQSALPAYAVPVFVRMGSDMHSSGGCDDEEGEAEEEDDKNGHDAVASDTPHAKTRRNEVVNRHGHLRTSTFKYIKHLLVKEGYEAARTTSVHDVCWQCTPPQGEDASTPTPDRYYVLVTNPAVYEQLCLAETDSHDAADAQKSEETRATALRQKKGYLPLTRETIALVGENFEKCGW